MTSICRVVMGFYFVFSVCNFFRGHLFLIIGQLFDCGSVANIGTYLNLGDRLIKTLFLNEYNSASTIAWDNFLNQ